MGLLSTLLIQNNGHSGVPPRKVLGDIWCLNISWWEVHGLDVPFPKYSFMTWQEIEGMITVSNS
jgi:hypothetical protein